MIYKAELIWRADAKHGESSWWDDRRQQLIFLDCGGSTIFCYDPVSGEKKRTDVPFRTRAVVGCEDGGYIAATIDEILKLDDDFNVTASLAKIEFPKPTDNFNDCKCGPDGAFWAGSMGSQGETDEGKFFRLSPDGKLGIALDNVAISNGFAWSADLSTLYYTDTLSHEIWAFDYDAETSALSNRRVIFRDEKMLPDGLTIDTEDRLWVAIWGGGKVICVDPADGSIVHEVIVEKANRTSSAMFGGPGMNTLFITTSQQGMSPEKLEKYPDSGSLFAVKLDACGRPMFRGRF